jgi:fibronectin type 3 domain-containing protein
LPAAFTAASNANKAGSFTSTGVAFSTMIAGVDAIPPSMPEAPVLSTSSSTGVTLTWAPSIDNIGVAGYNVYRNGTLATQVALPPFYDTALTPGNVYTYNLSAFDAQGNVSWQSAPLTVTLIDLSPPSVPANLSISGVTQNSISLMWAASTGGGGVGGYRLLKGNSPATMQVVAGYVLTTCYLDSHVTPSNTYYYAVESYNLSGVSSLPGPSIPANTLALPPPANLVATAVANRSISLSWSPSGGSDPPVGYRILKGNSPTSLQVVVASNPTTTYTDGNVSPNATFYYQVEMFDSMGITSAPGNMLTVTTP